MACGYDHVREVFYVGGKYVEDDQGTHTLQGQMYVEHLIPPSATEHRPFPLLFIHGGTRTGIDWLTKPDGNPGWSSFFLERGYEVYIVDVPFRGRSPWHPSNDRMIAFGAEQVQKMFTASERYGIWPQAKLHTQWPGSGLIGDPVFDTFYASTIQMLGDAVQQELASQAACVALLDRIGRPVVLIGHSQGGAIPYLTADIRPSLVKAIVNMEPIGPPFSKATLVKRPGCPYGITHAPITYEPPVTNPDEDLVKNVAQPGSPDLMECVLQARSPQPRTLVNLVNIPVLIVTTQASYHAQYDWGTVEYLRQAGVSTEHLKLEGKGILGNGHMMFLEMNSDMVAAEIETWIAQAV
ncbi:hypothetical protein PG993_012314 [Apiospora rasikravindrae]|uniref:AB hydrolase-1 domain-containing protein n=1 Tax=Apiospora rasikravindrae TaxID=990691 RepID=A0ABR1S2K2_9PEZI